MTQDCEVTKEVHAWETVGTILKVDWRKIGGAGRCEPCGDYNQSWMDENRGWEQIRALWPGTILQLGPTRLGGGGRCGRCGAIIKVG